MALFSLECVQTITSAGVTGTSDPRMEIISLQILKSGLVRRLESKAVATRRTLVASQTMQAICQVASPNLVSGLVKEIEMQ